MDWVLVITLIGAAIALYVVIRRQFPAKKKYVWKPETEYDIETQDFSTGGGPGTVGTGITTNIRLKPKKDKPHRGPKRRL